MRTFTFSSSLVLPRGLDELFPFFAEARNLETLTPSWLSFKVLTPEPIEMRPGTLIDYRLAWHGLPIRWRTVIDAWEPPHRFVDRMLKGPYRLWVHEHTFTAVDGGVRCDDRVEYAVPGGLLVQRLAVGRDVERIFAYRTERLQQLFGSCAPS
jgi:ligand-binding SRPBCC domain-containing protein